MASFTLQFDTSNAAYRRPDGSVDLNEVAATLHRVASRVGDYGQMEGDIRDFNGNKVGNYQTAEDADEPLTPDEIRDGEDTGVRMD